MLHQDLLALGVGIQNDAADFLVDLCRQLLRNRVGLNHVASEEDLLLTAAVVDRTDQIAHAVLGDHALCHGGRALDVVGGTGGDVVQCELFRNAAAQKDNQIVQHLLTGGIELILLRQAHCEAAGASARDNRDGMHRILRRQAAGGNRVSGLVVSGQTGLLLSHDAALLLRSHDDLEEGILDLVHGDAAAVAACGEQCRLVEQILQIRAGKSGGGFGNRIKVDIACERLAARMDFEDLLTTLHIRCADIDLTVKASRTEQRRIQNVLTVGRRDDDDTFVGAEAVHLNQQLVERLLALVVSAAQSGASVASDRVDLVDEHDGRRVLLRLFEQVAHARCADTDIQLDEVRTGDRQERHTGLTGDRTGDQRFACARRSDQQDALRNACADRGKLLRILQEFNDFLQLRLFLIRTGDVVECHLALVISRQLGASLAELHGAASAAVALTVEHKEPEQGENADQNDIRDDAGPPRNRGVRDIILLDDALFMLTADLIAQIVPENLSVGERVVQDGIVFERCLQLVVLDGKGNNLFVFKRIDDLRIGHGGLRLRLQQRGDQNNQEHQNNQVKSKTPEIAVAFLLQKMGSLLRNRIYTDQPLIVSRCIPLA